MPRAPIRIISKVARPSSEPNQRVGRQRPPRRALGRSLVSLAAGVALLGVTAGCPRQGVIDDGTSVSYGRSNHGKLLKPIRLPERGDGFWTPPRWSKRGLRFGTEELVTLLVHVARRLQFKRSATSEPPLGIADLSRRRGGPSPWHRSHQTGRDVDLLFFATDATGAPVTLNAMPHFDADGIARIPSGLADRPLTPVNEAETLLYFDVKRNWRLVKALITNPITPVQYLFIYDPLKQKLLEHARATGEPAALIQRAGYVLHQPGDSLPHDDHLHVRIYCPPSDRVQGCSDRGALRWVKKDYKYGSAWQVTSVAAQSTLASAIPTPMPAMLALGLFP